MAIRCEIPENEFLVIWIDEMGAAGQLLPKKTLGDSEQTNLVQVMVLKLARTPHEIFQMFLGKLPQV